MARNKKKNKNNAQSPHNRRRGKPAVAAESASVAETAEAEGKSSTAETNVTAAKPASEAGSNDNKGKKPRAVKPPPASVSSGDEKKAAKNDEEPAQADAVDSGDVTPTVEESKDVTPSGGDEPSDDVQEPAAEETPATPDDQVGEEVTEESEQTSSDEETAAKAESEAEEPSDEAPTSENEEPSDDQDGNTTEEPTQEPETPDQDVESADEQKAAKAEESEDSEEPAKVEATAEAETTDAPEDSKDPNHTDWDDPIPDDEDEDASVVTDLVEESGKEETSEPEEKAAKAETPENEEAKDEEETPVEVEPSDEDDTSGDDGLPDKPETDDAVADIAALDEAVAELEASDDGGETSTSEETSAVTEPEAVTEGAELAEGSADAEQEQSAEESSAQEASDSGNSSSPNAESPGEEATEGTKDQPSGVEVSEELEQIAMEAASPDAETPGEAEAAKEEETPEAEEASKDEDVPKAEETSEEEEATEAPEASTEEEVLEAEEAQETLEASVEASETAEPEESAKDKETTDAEQSAQAETTDETGGDAEGEKDAVDEEASEIVLKNPTRGTIYQMAGIAFPNNKIPPTVRRALDDMLGRNKLDDPEIFKWMNLSLQLEGRRGVIVLPPDDPNFKTSGSELLIKLYEELGMLGDAGLIEIHRVLSANKLIGVYRDFGHSEFAFDREKVLAAGIDADKLLTAIEQIIRVINDRYYGSSERASMGRRVISHRMPVHPMKNEVTRLLMRRELDTEKNLRSQLAESEKTVTLQAQRLKAQETSIEVLHDQSENRAKMIDQLKAGDLLTADQLMVLRKDPRKYTDKIRSKMSQSLDDGSGLRVKDKLAFYQSDQFSEMWEACQKVWRRNATPIVETVPIYGYTVDPITKVGTREQIGTEDVVRGWQSYVTRPDFEMFWEFRGHGRVLVAAYSILAPVGCFATPIVQKATEMVDAWNRRGEESMDQIIAKVSEVFEKMARRKEIVDGEVISNMDKAHTLAEEARVAATPVGAEASASPEIVDVTEATVVAEDVESLDAAAIREVLASEKEADQLGSVQPADASAGDVEASDSKEVVEGDKVTVPFDTTRDTVLLSTLIDEAYAEAKAREEAESAEKSSVTPESDEVAEGPIPDEVLFGRAPSVSVMDKNKPGRSAEAKAPKVEEPAEVTEDTAAEAILTSEESDGEMAEAAEASTEEIVPPAPQTVAEAEEADNAPDVIQMEPLGEPAASDGEKESGDAEAAAKVEASEAEEITPEALETSDAEEVEEIPEASEVEEAPEVQEESADDEDEISYNVAKAQALREVNNIGRVEELKEILDLTDDKDGFTVVLASYPLLSLEETEKIAGQLEEFFVQQHIVDVEGWEWHPSFMDELNYMSQQQMSFGGGIDVCPLPLTAETAEQMRGIFAEYGIAAIVTKFGRPPKGYPYHAVHGYAKGTEKPTPWSLLFNDGYLLWHQEKDRDAKNGELPLIIRIFGINTDLVTLIPPDEIDNPFEGSEDGYKMLSLSPVPTTQEFVGDVDDSDVVEIPAPVETPDEVKLPAPM